MNFVPYARTGAANAETIQAWVSADMLLAGLRQLPPKDEFDMLLEFLVQYSGGMEMAEHRMNETLTDSSAITYNAYAEAVIKIKKRICELYGNTKTQLEPPGHIGG